MIEPGEEASCYSDLVWFFFSLSPYYPARRAKATCWSAYACMMQLQSNPSLFNFFQASGIRIDLAILSPEAHRSFANCAVIEHNHMQGVIDRSLSAVLRVNATSVRSSHSAVARRARTSSDKEHVGSL